MHVCSGGLLWNTHPLDARAHLTPVHLIVLAVARVGAHRLGRRLRHHGDRPTALLNHCAAHGSRRRREGSSRAHEAGDQNNQAKETHAVLWQRARAAPCRRAFLG